MKTIILLLIPNIVLAQQPIGFQARIQNENLAEEAIEFLHCVSQSTDMPWEISEAKSPYHISLTEKQGELTGSVTLNNSETPVSMKAGEAKFICNKLFPPKQENPEIPVIFDSPVKSSKTWVTAGILTLALGLGIFLWKKQQPDYRGIRMN